MRDTVAMILAGGRVEELSVLTLRRPKAAVPFGGQYRMIDFALSALIQADIERVGVLSLYRPSSLIDHLGTGEPWDLFGRGRGVKILPPYVASETSQWYRGTADAVYQNLHFIRRHQPRDVLILSGDHVYNMDFRPLVLQHRDSDADLTLVVKSIPPENGRSRFGFAEVDHQGRVIGYQEKPSKPKSDLASLTIYLFKTKVLIQRLEDNARSGLTFQLYSEVLPEMVEHDRVFAYRYDGYWNYARSVDAYHQASMDLLGDEPKIRLDRWGVRSRVQLMGLGDLPPVRFEAGAVCIDSVVCPGVRIGGTVTRSVLSPGVVVEPGARVSDSVLMNDVVVRAGATVDRAVLDKEVCVGAQACLGYGEQAEPNQEVPMALASGVSLVGKQAQIPARAQVGRNCIIYPEIKEGDWKDLQLVTGSSLYRSEGEGI